MTPDELDKMMNDIILRTEEYQHKVESGELESIALEGEIKTWPLVEWSIDYGYGLVANPVNSYRGIRLQPIFSPMEYSHDDKDKRTE